MIEVYCEYLSVWCIDCVFLSCHTRVSGESTLCGYLNFKELFAQNRRHTIKFNDCNEIRADNHLPVLSKEFVDIQASRTENACLFDLLSTSHCIDNKIGHGWIKTGALK